MNLQQFLELFQPNPAESYMVVTTTPDCLVDSLSKKTEVVEGEFEVVLYGETKNSVHKTQHVEKLNKPFKSKPRSFDKVIFYNIFTKHQNIAMLLQLAYRSLANAAEVIVVEPKNTLNKEKMLTLLEQNEYRASNHIGDILKGYDIFTARKMHMWGNGL